MPTSSRPLIAALCALFACLGMSAAAAAQAKADDTINVTGIGTGASSSGSITRVAHVAKRDLDLSTLSGQRRLASRIGKAADAVCADIGLWTSQSTHDFYQCRNAAVATANAQVGSGLLAGMN